MRKGLVTAAVLAGAIALTAACGDAEPEATDPTPVASSSPSAEASPSAAPAETAPADAATSIEITISGDEVTPNGERVRVPVNEPIEFLITSDAAGTLHVHSDPEQELEYAAGTTVLELDPIDKPGIVEVESHDLHATIVQLEVR